MNPQLPFFAFPLGLPLVSSTNLMDLNQSPFNHSVSNLLASGLTFQSASPFYFGNSIPNIMALNQSDPVFETTKKQRLNTSEAIYSLFSNPFDSQGRSETATQAFGSNSEQPAPVEDDDCIFLGSVPKNQTIAPNCSTSNQSIDFANQGALLNLLTQQSFSGPQIDTSSLLSAFLQTTTPLDISMYAKNNIQYDSWNQMQINPLLEQQLNQDQAKQISCASTQSGSLAASRNSTSSKVLKNQEAILIDDGVVYQTTPSRRFEEASLSDAELKLNKKERDLKVKSRQKSIKNRTNLGLCLNKEDGVKQRLVIDYNYKSSQVDEQSIVIESIDTDISSEKEFNCSKQNTEYAVIPAFEMFDSPGNRNKRNIKSVWAPCSIGLDNYTSYHKKIEEAVGMEITNEEKVIQTLKDYNMSLRDACDTLRRNKANSKHFFKVQKKPRDRVAKI